MESKKTRRNENDTVSCMAYIAYAVLSVARKAYRASGRKDRQVRGRIDEIGGGKMLSYLTLGACVLLTTGFGALFIRMVNIASRVKKMEEIFFLTFKDKIEKELS